MAWAGNRTAAAAVLPTLAEKWQTKSIATFSSNTSVGLLYNGQTEPDGQAGQSMARSPWRLGGLVQLGAWPGGAVLG
jgi:hypothetical protein